MLYISSGSPSIKKSSPSHLSFFPKVTIFSLIILLSLCCQALRAQTQIIDEPKQLTGHENHKVTLSYAASLTKNFRLMTGATSSTILGEYFGKDALIATLNQENCVGLRIYYGKKDDSTPALVLVGVNRSGNDMTRDIVLEDGWPCPPICGPTNDLNDDEIVPPLSELNSSDLK